MTHGQLSMQIVEKMPFEIDAGIGHRARIGLLVLQTDQTLEAELTHLMALQAGIDSTLICFGKPRVFLKRPKERFPKGSALSVCSGSDIVTRVPRFCYTVGSSNQDFLYLANDGANYLNPDLEFVEKDFSIKDSVSDHSMELYLQRSLEVV